MFVLQVAKCAHSTEKAMKRMHIPLHLKKLNKRVSSAEQLGATEVHIVGGFHPDLPLRLL